MGYPNPIQASIRKIAANVVTVSCPFSIKDRLDVGARMSLIKIGPNVIIYSPIPYGPYMDEALQLLNGNDSSAKVTHLFIVNRQHNLAAKSFKDVYPELKIFAGYNVDLGDECPIDYTLTRELGNKVITGSDFKTSWGITEPWVDQLEVVLLRFHKNSDVVLLHKPSKVLFEGDVVFNLGVSDDNGEVEQYSPATGFPEKHYPFTGWSFLLRWMQPAGFLGKFFCSRLTQSATPEGLEGVKVVADLDFDVIVPCHGNVIDKDAKKVFRSNFKL